MVGQIIPYFIIVFFLVAFLPFIIVDENAQEYISERIMYVPK